MRRRLPEPDPRARNSESGHAPGHCAFRKTRRIIRPAEQSSTEPARAIVFKDRRPAGIVVATEIIRQRPDVPGGVDIDVVDPLLRRSKRLRAKAPFIPKYNSRA
jgi:hypothetical protein